MKILFYLPALACMLFFSCQNDESITKTESKIPFDNLKGEHFSGDVIKYVSSDVMDVICIDTDVDTSNYEMLIGIRHFGNSFENFCGPCKIIKRNKSFAIMNQGRVYCFNTNDDVSDLKPDTTYIELVNFAFYQGKYPQKLDNIIWEDIERYRQERKNQSLKSTPNCLSGGRGSTSCSISWTHPSLSAYGFGFSLGGQSQSVTCQPGQFACCYVKGIILKAECFSTTNSAPGMCYADKGGQTPIGWVSSMEECFLHLRGGSYRYHNGRLILNWE